MAEPINNSVSREEKPHPPINLENEPWWAARHGFTAQSILADAKDQDHAYAEALRRDQESRSEVTVNQAPPADKREGVIEDTKAAFRDYGIPEELAEEAVSSGRLDEVNNAADREAFYGEVLNAKRDQNEVIERNRAANDIEGVNDWRSAIVTASSSFHQDPERDKALIEQLIQDAERGTKSSPQQAKDESSSVKNVKSGLSSAQEHWAARSQELRDKYPLVTDERDLRKIDNAGSVSAWVVSKLPTSIQTRFGLSEEKSYQAGADKAYEKWADKSADKLLSERGKALQTLRSVDGRIEPHLLSSKQYRAAETLTKTDQELRRLRPLSGTEYSSAVTAAIAGTDSRKQQTSAQAQPEKTRQQPSVETKQQAVSARTKHEHALAIIREIQAQTPVDGFRTKASDAMTKNIVRQLQDSASTVVLSTKYAGGDQGQANSTHANAIEANKVLIDAVRQQGIHVDTGKASVAAGKKAEVELSQQVEQDQSLQILQ